jgi:hypothetical protein
MVDVNQFDINFRVSDWGPMGGHGADQGFWQQEEDAVLACVLETASGLLQRVSLVIRWSGDAAEFYS